VDSERLTLSQSTSNRAPDIVLIEDNEDSIMSTRLALNQAKLAINLCHAKDGMVFLRKARRARQCAGT
jgi:hypothetical protein